MGLENLKKSQKIILLVVAGTIFLATLVSLALVGKSLTYYYQYIPYNYKYIIEEKCENTGYDCDGNKNYRRSQEAIMFFNVLILVFVPLLLLALVIGSLNKKMKQLILIFLVIVLLPNIICSLIFLADRKSNHNLMANMMSNVPSALSSWAASEFNEKINDKKMPMNDFFPKYWNKLRKLETSTTDYKGKTVTIKYCQAQPTTCVIPRAFGQAFEVQIAHVIIFTLLGPVFALILHKSMKA